MATPKLNNRAKKDRSKAFWFPDITGRIGGAATDLDAIKTVSASGWVGDIYVTGGQINLPMLVIIYIAGSGAELWQLAAGNDAEDGVFVVRPDDYAAGTNEKVWKRVL